MAPAPSLTSEQTTTIARALADPRRFAIFEQIAHNDDILCSALDMHECLTAATISHHLKDSPKRG